jgi:hypothetical protein
MTPRNDQTPAEDGPGHHVPWWGEHEKARAKLLALAEALADMELRHRLLEPGQEQAPLLRVWDSRIQHLGETVACHRLDEGWRFVAHPAGPVLADADGITVPEDAEDAARVVAARVMIPRTGA